MYGHGARPRVGESRAEYNIQEQGAGAEDAAAPMRQNGQDEQGGPRLLRC